MARRGSEPFAEQSLTLQNTDYTVNVLSKLNQLRLENSLTDIILIASGEEIACHKNVLAISSSYFKAMFSGELRESREDKIVLKEISPWTLRRIIDYAYSGTLEITVDNAQDMLAAGSLFQYEEIINACCDFLCKQLHPSNCLGIEHFAHLHSCLKLESEAHQYVLDNYSIVVDHDEFLEIPLHRLLTYLVSDLIDVRNEEIVYISALRWIHHDLNFRKVYASQILSHVRLATIDVSYLSDVIQVDPIIQQCKKCSTLVQDALQYHETKTEQIGQRRRSMQSETTTPRPSTVAREVLVVVGGITNNNMSTNSVDMYDSAKDKWYSLPDMTITSSWFSVVALNNDIYTTGGIEEGCNGNRLLSDVWKFESSKRVWTKMCSMLKARARHASAVYEGNIYVLGGITLNSDNKLSAIESIECFQPSTNKWTNVGHCPFPKKQSHLVPFRKTLLEVGGSRGDYPEETMETFLLNDNVVVHSGEQFRLPAPIQFAQIVEIDTVFFIIWENLKKMILFNPEKRTFRDLSPMNHTHIHGGATVLNGKIYITGGLVDSRPSKIVECFDLENNSWSTVKAMPQRKACQGCVTIQMR